MFKNSTMRYSKTQVVKADTVDQAQKICPWATIFQRTKDWRETNNWKCAKF